MQADTKSDVLKRLNFIEGHLAGIRRMVEADKYCVDVLKQTYAVRRAIEKMENIMLSGQAPGDVRRRRHPRGSRGRRGRGAERAVRDGGQVGRHGNKGGTPMAKTLMFDVRGMTCDNCVQHVTKAVRGVAGVTDVKVDLDGKSAKVEGDFDERKIVEAIEEEGYEAAVRG
jgi:DNA-binding FrmR family transcriptional regulator/copper chaperone CopZ